MTPLSNTVAAKTLDTTAAVAANGVKEPVTATQVRSLFVQRGPNFWLNSTLKEALRAAAVLRSRGEQVRSVVVFDPVNERFIRHHDLLSMGIEAGEVLNYVVMVQTAKGIVGYPPAMVTGTKLQAEALKGLREAGSKQPGPGPSGPHGSLPPAA